MLIPTIYALGHTCILPLDFIFSHPTPHIPFSHIVEWFDDTSRPHIRYLYHPGTLLVEKYTASARIFSWNALLCRPLRIYISSQQLIRPLLRIHSPYCTSHQWASFRPRFNFKFHVSHDGVRRQSKLCTTGNYEDFFVRFLTSKLYRLAVAHVRFLFFSRVK